MCDNTLEDIEISEYPIYYCIDIAYKIHSVIYLLELLRRSARGVPPTSGSQGFIFGYNGLSYP